MLSGLLFVTPLWSHPISLTTARIEVQSQNILVEMDVMLEDLVLFHQIKPVEGARYSVETLRSASEQHRDFLLAHFVLLDGAGQALSGSIDRVDASAIETGYVEQEALMEKEVVFHLNYPIPKRLQFLTIVQRFGSGDVIVPAMMDVTVRRGAEWLHRPSQLMTDQALTIALDHSAHVEGDESRWEALKRQKEEAAQRRLGISSYSALYSFIYVTRKEVRHEVLVPLLTFEEWLPLKRNVPDILTVEEQTLAAESIGTFFQERAPVLINGKWIRPRLDRLQFFGVDIRDFAIAAPSKDVNVYQARLGVMMRYEVGETPKNVAVPWKIYGKNASAVQSIAMVNDETPERVRFWKGDDTWEWESEMEERPPIASLGVAVPIVGFSRLPVVSLLVSLATCALGLALLRPNLKRRLKRVSLTILLGGSLAVICWPLGQVRIGGARVSEVFDIESDGNSIGANLVKTVYQAFNEASEERAYDVLSQAVHGDLLEGLYLQLREGLIFREQGGAVAEVGAVDLVGYEAGPLEIDYDGRIHFGFTGRWTVWGSIEHWGHLHRRHHEYTARIRVFGGRDGWRIEEIEVLDEHRSELETSLRSLN